MAKRLPDVDPLSFLPLRYEDMRTPVRSSSFEEGVKVLAEGKIMSMDISSGWRGDVLTARLEDEGGFFYVTCLTVTRFHRTVFSMLGRRLYLWGAPRKKDSGWVFYHPELPNEVGRIFPVYRCPQGISMQRIRCHVQQLARELIRSIRNELPEDLMDLSGLPSLAEALRRIHFPAEQLPGAEELKRVALAACKDGKRTSG